MKKYGWTANLALIALAVGGLLAVSGLIPLAEAVPPPGGGSGCEGDVKIDGGVSGGNHVYYAPAGESITSICIKAGNDVFTFDCGVDDSTGCYDVTWTEGSPGCCTSVEIGGGGTGNDCKDISHTAATFGGPPCDECVPEPERCDNGVDDDCDGLVDCDDPDCADYPDCDQCVPEPERCDNGIDDDCDGLTDCEDSVDCRDDPACNECVPEPERCDNGIDDDCDGLTDCEDGPDCREHPACL